MGWNDRFSNRQEFINDIIIKLKQNYPSDILFDFVKFGALTANANSIPFDFGFTPTINLNLAYPDRTTFSFVTSTASAAQGDIYTNNNSSFTVTQAISNGNVLICTGNATINPFTSGTLIKSSGSGDDYIDYSSFVFAPISDAVVAFGFKNFYQDHPYNISQIILGSSTYAVENTISDVIVPDPNWQPLVSGGSLSLSINNNGPRDSYSLDFTAFSDMVLRRPISVATLQTAKIANDTNIGDTIIGVNDVTFFNIGDTIDILDKNLAAL
jgi:hypothetical protein